MIRFYLLIILFLPALLYSQQGEIILDDTNITIENETKQFEETEKTTPKEEIKQKKKIDYSEKLEKELINKNEYIKIITDFFERFFNELNSVIESKVKTEIEKHSKNNIKPNNKLKKEVDKLIKNFKTRINALIKSEQNYKEPKKRKKKASLKILSIRVGNDKPKQAITGQNNLPIVITVLSHKSLRKGTLNVYARDMKDGKEYLIYKLDPFSLNKQWAQDQNVWNGEYINKNTKDMLAKGKYHIVCYLMTENKKVKRLWGKGNKNYYISVE